MKYKIGDRIGPYNILLVERYAPDEKKKYRGKFLCPFCSTKEKPVFFIAIIDNVKRGNTRSCGCEHTKQRQKMGRSNLIDLTGKKFGKLIVLGDFGFRDKNNHVLWVCQCDCGDRRIVKVTTSNLKTGAVNSCGCGYSVGETRIKQVLEQNGYSFETQYQFDNCVNPKTNSKLRFDFFLPDYNTCIEYDGEQHFHSTSGWNDEKHFQETQYKDSIKNVFCKQNDIRLIRIPYYDYDKIDISYLEKILEIN